MPAMVKVEHVASGAADVFITETELRRRLGYSRSTVARLRARGLPHVGRDRLRRYEWAGVLEWLSQYVY